jgi:hypothetical protein
VVLCAIQFVELALPRTHHGPEWTACENLQIDPWCLLKLMPLSGDKLQCIAIKGKLVLQKTAQQGLASEFIIIHDGLAAN